LKELTLARRPATQKNPAAGVADALLAELSASSLLPFRDDRGVVVTLRALFNAKDQLNREAESQLDTLGKVAKAHPEFPLLAVVHVARGNASTRDAAQAAAIADALRKSGAPQVAAETAGSTLPILDPAHPGASDRNARIEVVFVAPSSS
jgi:outer membrane protein OmpA-like peptidoglycan-associated protein